ncbi:hypothetical protein ZIOFF_047556 [Zingiber officinale]|uniref:Dirigent protein n=1 Tax=Zingiber officinale TaxID=94328 RepID=A0A8J5FXI1_ZINOF|nr:hypothetical protein ZIOFF_047556 [Zingiber officinale]
MMKMAVSSPSFLLFIILSLAVVAFPQHRSTHLHFYVLSRFFGSPNPTVTFSVILHLESPMEGFGNLGVFDDIIIAGLDPSSPVIGRVQGSTANTDLTGHSSTSTINLVFTAGEYNGSSLMVLGRFLMGGMSDRSIIGGTGLFRLARGYILSQDFFNSPKSILSVHSELLLCVFSNLSSSLTFSFVDAEHPTWSRMRSLWKAPSLMAFVMRSPCLSLLQSFHNVGTANYVIISDTHSMFFTSIGTTRAWPCATSLPRP